MKKRARIIMIINVIVINGLILAALFLPLLDEYCIIAPDVIGMPGKSDPYRNISSKKG